MRAGIDGVDMQKNVKLAVATAFAVVVVIFAIQNAEPVGVDLLIWTWTGSRALILFVVFLAGVATGWLARAAGRPRRR